MSQGEILQMKIIDVYVTHTHTERATITHLINPPSAVIATALSSTAELGSLWQYLCLSKQSRAALHRAMPGAGHSNPCNNIFIPQIFINFCRFPDRIHYLQAFTRTSGETGPATLLTSINSAPLKSTQLCQLALAKN